jgi:HEPN domain-containing protein
MKDTAELYKEETLEKFYKENIEMLYLLEEAYITSRYLPSTYEEEIAKRALKLSNAIMGLLECLEER